MLTGAEILKRVKAGDIRISDFDIKRLNPNSYNLRISNKIAHYDRFDIGDPMYEQYDECGRTYRLRSTFVHYYPGTVIDSKKENKIVEEEMPEDGYILYPGILYLGSTIESTWAKDLIPAIDGRSSTGRLGIEIHRTAGFGDIGFEGTWTLEITAVHPVKIYPGQELCQIYFEKPDGDTSITYKGRYQNQDGIVASRMYQG